MNLTPTEGLGVGLVAGRSPLAQLLHALNQPLTGLQCSLEVALAAPRTAEQYVLRLRDALELTGRVRTLVEAIREVLDLDQDVEAETSQPETTELKIALQEVLDDLAPVPEARSIRVAFDCPRASALTVRGARRRLQGTVFRFLESALSLAARGSVFQIEAGEADAEILLRVQWRPGGHSSTFTGPELGLMVAQASFERAGATWQRERAETLETVIVRLPGVSKSGRFP